MDVETITQNVEQYINNLPEPEEPVAAPQLTDLWEERRRAIRDQPRATVRGARPKLNLDLNDLLARGIKEAYKKAIDDRDLLRAEGETERARIVEQQYMQDWFYPIVDALVRMNSVQEVLASQDALEALDSLVITPSGGSNQGYTSIYVSELYEPVEGQIFTSDAEIRDGIRRINAMCDGMEMRSAIALANKLQLQVDSGANRATPEDYELLQKIALRGQ